MSDAESQAYELLLRTWCDDVSTCRLPIDPFSIAGTLGLKIERIVLEPDVSGMLAKRAGEDPEVFINQADSDKRQRFSCAHEVGHYIKRTTTGPVEAEWGYIDRRGPSASDGNNPDEIFANQFAAALLMPEVRIREMVTEGVSAVSMALTFDVSLEAMAHRRENLGLPRE